MKQKLFHSSRRFLAVASMVCVMCVGSARGDELADWLEAHALDELLATRLELLTKQSTGDELKRVRERLASTYVRLLDLSVRGKDRAALVARANGALEESLGDATHRLDLAIARAHYRGAAEIAEDLRAAVRLPTESASFALAELALAIPTLERLQKESMQRASDLDRRIDSMVGLTQDLARQDIQRVEQIASDARFLLGWAHLYKCLLSESRAEAEASVAIFAEIAGARNGRLEPAEVSMDLRGEEAFASALLGLGLAKAETQGYGEASRWLKLLEEPTTFEATRARLDGWRLAAAVRAKDWASARTVLKALASQDSTATAWYRVAAAGGLRDTTNDGAALALAREALAQLATKRELAQVRDIVEQFGGRGLEGDGFVARYVASLSQYDTARATDTAYESARLLAEEQGSSVDTSALENVVRANREALNALEEALAAADVDGYPEARDGCKLMRAWSLRGARAYREAAKAFEEVAVNLTGERGEDAAWASIACLDEYARTMRGAERTALEAEIALLSDGFLRRFPASLRVIDLMVRRVQTDSTPSTADVEKLLSVPSTDPSFDSSRRAALGALYRNFRAAKVATERTALGRRYIGVLVSLPIDPTAEGLPGNSVGIARQALEVALANEVLDTALAASLLTAIDASVARGEFELAEAREELAYRRLQLAIMQNQWELVESGLAQFELPSATDLWADAGLRLALRGAEIARRATAKDDPRRSAFVATSVRAAEALLLREGGLEKAAQSPANVAFVRVLLDARKEMVLSSASSEDAKRGLQIAQVLIDAGNREAGILQSAALFAEKSGAHEVAVGHLKSLVSGLATRTEPWFAAKYDLARVLLLIDADRSAAVLEQHRKLHADLGPGLWKERFEALEIEVRSKQGTTRGATP